ncbi:MAG: autotransporter-associated beta strand repeat-containing protein [Haloferula sp.]
MKIQANAVVNVDDASSSLTVNSAASNGTSGAIERTANGPSNTSAAGGSINVTAGTFTLNDADAGATGEIKLFSTNNTAAEVNLTGGAMEVTGLGGTSDTVTLNGNINVSNNATLEALGGSVLGAGSGGGVLSITGDTATVTLDNLDVGSSEWEVEFTVGAAGVTPITGSGSADLGLLSLTVDGSSYTGGPGVVDLLTYNDFTTGIDPGNVTLTGFAGTEGINYYFEQDAVAGFARVVIVSIPLPPIVWDASTDSDWTNPDSTSWSGETYDDGDGVVFPTAGAGPVNIASTVSPGSVLVDSSNDYTFSGSDISGLTGLTMEGGGILALASANTYTGTTEINGSGILQADAADVAASSGALGNGGAISFGGGTLQYTANSAATDYSPRIQDSGGTMSFDTNGQDVTLASLLADSNTGGLTKFGSGKLTVEFDSLYTGLTKVDGGTLTLLNDTGLKTWGAGNFEINSGSTLEIVASGQSTVFQARTFTFDSGGGGTINLSGNNIFQTTSTIATTGGSTNTVSGSGYNMQNIRTIKYVVAVGDDDVDLEVSANHDRGSIIKEGAGTISLTNTSNNLLDSNAVTISSGALEIAGAGRLTFGSNGSNINNDGVFEYKSSANQTLNGDVSGSGDLVKSSTGALILNGTNSYTGTTQVNEGCLVLGQAAASPDNGLTTSVAAGAGFGFDPAGLSDVEIKTIVDNVTWDVDSDLVFTVDAPDSVAVSADLSGFDGSTIVLKGDGTLNLSGATLPLGVIFETPDGGTIIGIGSGDIVIDSITTGPGTNPGTKMVTLAFTSAGNVDAYASDTLLATSWSLVASDISSSPAVVEDNVAADARFYVLVPAGSGNPYP